MYKDLKFLTEDCNAEKDVEDMKGIRGYPRLEMLHDVK